MILPSDMPFIVKKKTLYGFILYQRTTHTPHTQSTYYSNRYGCDVSTGEHTWKIRIPLWINIQNKKAVNLIWCWFTARSCGFHADSWIQETIFSWRRHFLPTSSTRMFGNNENLNEFSSRKKIQTFSIITFWEHRERRIVEKFKWK